MSDNLLEDTVAWLALKETMKEITLKEGDEPMKGFWAKCCGVLHFETPHEIVLICQQVANL